ncbi:MAG: peptidoglycan editing factor PgeF [Nitrospirota bacterium]|nr:peptidoglycan editing factor PgeF [Nitrospirota bacterium]
MERRNSWSIDEGGGAVLYGGFAKKVTAFFGTRAMDDEALFERLGIEADIFVKQTHSTEILAVDSHRSVSEWIEEGKKGYDGIVTDRPGWAVAIYTADCVPVLLYDGRKKVCAAVHAGWRGTAGEIVKKAVEVMREKYGSRPADIGAAIGPCIGSCCYQVDDAVYNSFRLYPWKGEVFREDGPRWRLNLKDTNRRQLMEAGLADEKISSSHLCTACRTDLFFSYRLEGSTGRMVSGIVMKG